MKLVLILLSVMAISISAQQYNLAKWGMSQSQVKAIEDKELLNETPNLITYEGHAFGYPALINYNFEDNKLKMIYIGYVYSDEFQILFKDFLDVRDNLAFLYDEPTEQGGDWKNNELSDYPERYDEALHNGDVTFYSQWNIEGDIIALVIEGPYTPHTMTIYFGQEE
ncbi:MAG: hypothetical protein SCALA702_38240 [Melioribacteraceae bacterium]|nr:MAG: hypothetical protein SCALA702_38240 [Melioribacteraceae bacterium]